MFTWCSTKPSLHLVEQVGDNVDSMKLDGIMMLWQISASCAMERWLRLERVREDPERRTVAVEEVGVVEVTSANTTVTITTPNPTVTAVSECNTVAMTGNFAVADMFGLLGVIVRELSVLVGLRYSSVTILGIGAR
ncbi:hypothetical protein MPER_12191 [Moniliophthora perniciosa FA553]|nr:hypothetical protein MPER_12191 [Moniliophthora perniciosa FA553]